MGWGNESLFKGPGHITNMAIMLIFGKNLKQSSLEPKVDDLERLYAASGTQHYEVCSNDDPVLTLTYFTAMSYFVPYAFVWEKRKLKQWIFQKLL